MKPCEAELEQEREQQRLERYKLELIKEGKILDLTAGDEGESGAGRSPNFDVSGCLRLVPKFSERAPDTFFLLYERLAKIKKWSDSEQTLLLQSVLTGKSQEAFSALSISESENFLKVKMAALRAYELVPEAYRQKFRGAWKHDKKTYVEFARKLSTFLVVGAWHLKFKLLNSCVN